jgi:cytochrome c553
MAARIIWLGLLGFTVLSGCGASAGEGSARGEVLFVDNCGPCHGPSGQGSIDPELGAPAIAGLPEWYVKVQLEKYRDGIRGAHPSDVEGLRMRPMSRTLMHNLADYDHVSAYVASMPVQPADRTLQGDAEAGKALYATCAACHGADGAGNQAMGAPPIAQMDDWYLERQLHKFKKGLRAYDKRDIGGNSMKAMAMTLKDDKAVQDVVTYIGTLSKGGQ